MIERVLMEYVANALWQIPLLAGGAWILLWMVRPRPQVQHGVWLAVLGLATLLPMHGMGAASGVAMDAQSARGAQQGSTVAWGERAVPLETEGLPGTEGLRLEWAPRLHSVHLVAAAVYWIVALYVGAMLLGMFRIARAWSAARRLVEDSREVALCARGVECFEEYGQRLGVRLPRIRESEEVRSPMIVGVVAPVLLLPVGFGGFTEDEVRAVLCHELAHVKRRDYLVNVMCQVVALPVVWHPVVHGVQGRIRRTREMVCDALAAREMESEIGYAKCLLALARGMVGSGGLVAQADAPGLFGDNMLEERVMRLMETKMGMSVRAKVARVASGMTAMMAATALAAVFHVVPTMAEVQAATLPVTAQSAVEVAQASSGETKAVDAVPAVAPQSEAVQAAPKKGVTAHRRKGEAGRASVVKGERWEGLTPEEQRDIKKAIADAKEQVAKATADLNSPEFKKQMADAQRQIAEAAVKMNSPEFKKQMADAQRQVAEATAKMNSPEFKKQMADAQRQASEAALKMNSPEFKQQMAEMQRKVAEATAKMNSPEFKKQMADAQRQASAAAAKMNSPEFRQKMTEAQEKMREAMQGLKDAQPQGGDEPMKIK
jgi:bla regulator protein BlaR1